MRKTRSQTQAERAANSNNVNDNQNVPANNSIIVLRMPSENQQVTRNEVYEIKNILSYFRINELQTLLTAFRAYHTGRKQDLQKRALYLLDSNFTEVSRKIREIYRNIQTAEKSLQLDEPLPKKTMYQPLVQLPVPPDAISIMGDNTIMTNNVMPFANQPSVAYPIHPDVKFRKLPFYEIISTILRPSTMIPSNNQRLQETTFRFTLTPQQATEIAVNRDIRNPSNVEHMVQVQLRFCLLETSGEQDDCFPPNILVKVNNKICALPSPIPTNRPNVEPKRPSRPVNVTAHVKLSPTVVNSIAVQWGHVYNKLYVITACLVRKLSSQELLTQLKLKGSKAADFTRVLIKEKLNEDPDSEIATTMLKVSLMCPLGKMRMNIPCRATTCSHLQCFDALLFLQMNERKPTWHCPVCDKLTFYDDLVIDGYFQEVLESLHSTPNVNEIQLHQDGSWSVQSEVIDVSSESTQNVEVIFDDFDVITDEARSVPVMRSLVLSNNIEPAPSTNNDIIDLTFGDSNEDLPLATINAVPCSSSTQNKTETSKLSKRKIDTASLLSIPYTSRPSTSRPYTSIPSTSIPSTSIPYTSIPSTSRPYTSIPSTSIPYTSIPSTSTTFTSRPSTSTTFISRPSTSKPSTSRPYTSRPSTSRPSTFIPSTSIPYTSIPSTSRPSTSTTFTTRPSTSITLTLRPSTSKPSTSKPSTSKPSTSKPSTSRSPILIEDNVIDISDDDEAVSSPECFYLSSDYLINPMSIFKSE